MNRIVASLATVAAITSPVAATSQVTFEQTASQLASKDADARMRAVQMLKGAAYPEAAVPLAQTVIDERNDIQLESIAAELNIFLADKVTPRKRVGFLVEVRGRIAAEPIFNAAPSALGSRRVPLTVARALIAASHDDDPRVALEAVYALGSLGPEVAAADRAPMLAEAAPVLAGLIGAPDPGLRYAAVRVSGHLFTRRQNDPEIEEHLGDAVIAALNDREDPVREAAMWALGAMRYERSVRGLGELFQYYRKGPLAVAAFDAIARIAHPASLPDLVGQLGAKDAAIRTIAIEGIARSGDRGRAEGVQLAIAREGNDAVLLAAHFSNAMLADGAVDTIVEALSRDRLHDQAAGYVNELAASRADALLRYVQDPEPAIRLAVIEALGLSGNAAAATALRPALDDKDPEVQRAAARALARLGA
jgi:HEAT repeat protein